MKKVFSALLSLIMIISVIPFYAVESSAASVTSTGYTVKVRVYTDVDADGWNSAYVKVFGASFTATHTFPVSFNELTLDANGGTGSMDSVKFLDGDSYTLPENGFTAPSGYGFKCWEVDGEDKEAGDEITLTGSTVIKAKWGVLRTVSFNSGAGTGTMAGVQVVDGTYYKLPDSSFTAPDRKQFDSWQTGTSAFAAGESILIESDMTFTASYVAKRYAISVSGVNVTADNCSDILGDGSVSYDPDTNTMVLTNAAIEVSKYGDGSAAFGIRHNETFDNTPFVIVLNGENNIVDNVADNGVNEKWGVGIYGATGYYTQYFMRADINKDKAVDAFDLFILDKRIGGLV